MGAGESNMEDMDHKVGSVEGARVIFGETPELTWVLILNNLPSRLGGVVPASAILPK
jgi:hypothetical protein